MLCFQEFCRAPCSTDLLCPIGTFCNSENVCEEPLLSDELVNSKEGNPIFSDIIFKTLSEFNEKEGIDGEIQDLITNIRRGDHLEFGKERKHEARNPLDIGSMDYGRKSFNCGSQCRKILLLLSRIPMQKDTSGQFVKSENLQSGDIIKISKRRDLSKGKIKAPNEEESVSAATDRTLVSKTKSVLDLPPQQPPITIGSNQSSLDNGRLRAAELDTKSQELRISESNKIFMKTFIETLLASMKKESLENNSTETPLSMSSGSDTLSDNTKGAILVTVNEIIFNPETSTKTLLAKNNLPRRRRKKNKRKNRVFEKQLIRQGLTRTQVEESAIKQVHKNTLKESPVEKATKGRVQITKVKSPNLSMGYFPKKKKIENRSWKIPLFLTFLFEPLV